MRYLAVLMLGACSLCAAADVIDFENTDADLSLFNYNEYPSTSLPWSSTLYGETTGVGGSNGITPVQAMNLQSAVYQNPIEIDNGVRTISIDFNFPVLNTFGAPKFRIGFTGENTGGLASVGSGCTLLFISDDTFPSGTTPRVDISFVAIDQTDTIDNYASSDSVLALSANHWYQATVSATVIGDMATTWGSIVDIGQNGTSVPNTIWSVSEAQGLSFPASLLNNGFAYGGFGAYTINGIPFPLDNFVTPEPTVVGFLGFGIAAMLKRRRRGSRVHT